MVRLDPDHIGALSDLGRAYTLRGDFAAAIAPLERAAAMDPRRPGLLQTLNRAKEGLAEQGAAGPVSP